MNGLKDFFNCCGSILNNPQIIVNTEEKRRSLSQQVPGKRIFIKRSMGKNPILNFSIKDTNISTGPTPKGSKYTQVNQIDNQNSIIKDNHTFDISIVKSENLSQKEHKQSGTKLTGKNYRNREKIEQFVNFSDYHEKQFRSSWIQNENEKILMLLEPQILKIFQNNPRKIVNHRQKQEVNRISEGQNCHPIKDMKTIVEAIDERSSIPSMEESQMNSIRQNSSKININTNFYEMNPSKNFQFPLSDRFQSMIITPNRSKQSLGVWMANSQFLQSEDAISEEKLNNMAIGKLQMENTILEQELIGLNREYFFLKQQRQFNLASFRDQIDNMPMIKEEYERRAAQCQSQIEQLNQILKGERANHRT